MNHYGTVHINAVRTIVKQRWSSMDFQSFYHTVKDAGIATDKVIHTNPENQWLKRVKSFFFKVDGKIYKGSCDSAGKTNIEAV